MLKTITSLSSALFPRTCIGCDREEAVHKKLFCNFCWEELPRFQHDTAMSKILYSRFPLIADSQFYGLFLFTKGGIVQEVMHKMKYKGRSDIAWDLGTLIAEFVPPELYEAMIPIPMHRKKRVSRGYNQAKQIAKGISKKTTIPILSDILQKMTDTKSQTQKSKVERKQDVAKAYQLKNRLPPSAKRVLLIDDVITTGATLDHCTEKIKEQNNVEIDYAFIALSV